MANKLWFKRFFILAIFPIGFLLASIPLTRWHGPGFLSGNSDPDYAYLMNSASVRNGFPPGHWDHPGTTIQGLGGLALLVMHPRLSGQEMSREVVSDPEKYLIEIEFVLSCFCALALWMSGIRAAGAFNKTWVGVLFQTSPFLTQVSWSGTSRLTPDVPLLCLCMLFAATALKSMKPNSDLRRSQTKLALQLGIIFGLILTTKITGLLFLILIPIVFFKNTRALVFFGVAVIATSSVVIFTVIRSAWKGFLYYFTHWIFAIATHQGAYGSGATGLPAFSILFHALLKLCSNNPLFVLILALGTMALLIRPRAPLRSLLICALAVGFIQLAIVSIHPNPRYLIPGFAATALILILLPFQFFPHLLDRMNGGLCSIFCIFVALGIPLSMGFDRKYIDGRTKDLERVEAKIQTEGCVEVPAYRSTSIPFALAFGNNFTNRRFSKLLSDVYPRFITFDPSVGFLDFDRNLIDPDKMRISGKKYCIRGWKASVPVPTPYPFSFMSYRDILDTETGDSLFLVQWTKK